MTQAAESAPHSHDPIDSISLRVAQRIRQARLERGMSLAQLGGSELTRGFLHLVETGRSSISLRALAVIAARLNLPVSYFVDEAPLLAETADVTVDQVEAAIAYSRYLRSKGKTREALEYALWAAQARLTHDP